MIFVLSFAMIQQYCKKFLYSLRKVLVDAIPSLRKWLIRLFRQREFTTTFCKVQSTLFSDETSDYQTDKSMIKAKMPIIHFEKYPFRF